ncbi:uncharacterized protein LOC121071436 isoform X2 [Cygnus olor]|uniref:uncharacterized protein LOC121071436 isoform X2 n=1 Tax=Cygnus olor TaxID=8869 RepID=UPI001ADE39D1|nr:uncharacterized protein LOC121071436 isoform X2 [Cygnus olor]
MWGRCFTELKAAVQEQHSLPGFYPQEECCSPGWGAHAVCPGVQRSARTADVLPAETRTIRSPVRGKGRLLFLQAALLSVQSFTQGTRACDALALQRRVDVCLAVLVACGIGLFDSKTDAK